MLGEVVLHPIGVIHTPFSEKIEAPRQPRRDQPADGTVELVKGKGFEHALEDVEGFQFIWLLFLFDKARGWNPKVLPPRSEEKRGVFATRAPHRPNPIGMSVVELVSIEGLTLKVRGVDMLDGTPLLDIKPYVPYADARPDAKTGWLEAPKDPKPDFTIAYDPLARTQIDFLAREGVDLGSMLERALALGPQPHPYRRIREDAEGLRIAVKDWRARFRVAGETIVVQRVMSGFKDKELTASKEPAIEVHRRFRDAFPG